MTSPDDLLELIRQHVEALGFELVDFRQRGSRQRPLLQVRIDRPGSSPGHGVTARDCTQTSRSLERALEALDRLGERYVLQVSSPGLERPVRFPEHWQRFVGRAVRLRGPFPGHPVAEIVAAGDTDVTLRFPGEEVRTFALDEIEEANLVVDWNTVGRPEGRKK
ncbi:MAG: ribosome maturation factor RimP [Gemmatimonadales bacterium]